VGFSLFIRQKQLPSTSIAVVEETPSLVGHIESSGT